MRKKKINSKVLAGSVIIFLMVSSIFGVLFYGFNAPSEDRVNEYNGRIFKFKGGNFISDFEGKNVFFSFFPAELESISVDERAKVLLNNDFFVVTYDPKSSLASDMALAQFKFFEERFKPLKKDIVRALTETSGSVLEKKSCDDGTEKNPVIFFEYSNETKILGVDNCIVAKVSSAGDVYKVSDRISYLILGVME
jgi:hypothetical protein